MHQLSASFVLGYHGCDRVVGRRLLDGEPFRPSANDYDWLGPGVYFWEANPLRGLEFAHEASKRKGSSIRTPFVVGAILDLGLCLDLTTSTGIDQVRRAYASLGETQEQLRLPRNRGDGLLRNLDCAVIRRLHKIREMLDLAPVDSVKGVFVEGGPLYPTAGFHEKTHVQIAIRNLDCIKGVFRVPDRHLRR